MTELAIVDELGIHRRGQQRLDPFFDDRVIEAGSLDWDLALGFKRRVQSQSRYLWKTRINLPSQGN